MSRATREIARLDALRGNGCFKLLLQGGITRRSVGVVQRFNAQFDIASRGNGGQPDCERLERNRANLVIARPHVNAEFHILRDHVDRTGLDREFANGTHKPCMVGAKFFDKKNHFGCRRQRVLSRPHRHRARMSSKTCHIEKQPRRPCDGGHHANRQPLVEQNRTLLDMRFNESDHLTMLLAAAIKLAPLAGITAKVVDGLPHGHAISVSLIKPCRIKRTGHRFAANERRRETHPLLIAETNHF